MATVQAGDNVGLDMTLIDFSFLYDGLEYKTRSKLFEVTYANGWIDTFRGKRFDYDKDGRLVDGTVRSFSEDSLSDNLFSIFGASVSAKAISKAAQTVELADDYKIILKVFEGNDTIRGGASSDNLFGHNGDDKIIGGPGTDGLIGGKGADHFIYTSTADGGAGAHGIEIILDFNQQQGDKIDLSALGDSLEFGVNVITAMDDFTVVLVDVNADEIVDLGLSLYGEIELRASDFIL